MTLAMGGVQFTISGSMSIVGPGANLLTLDNANVSRIFNARYGITNHDSINISALSMTRGSTTTGDGGAIFTNVCNCRAGHIAQPAANAHRAHVASHRIGDFRQCGTVRKQLGCNHHLDHRLRHHR